MSFLFNSLDSNGDITAPEGWPIFPRQQPSASPSSSSPLPAPLITIHPSVITLPRHSVLVSLPPSTLPYYTLCPQPTLITPALMTTTLLTPIPTHSICLVFPCSVCLSVSFDLSLSFIKWVCLSASRTHTFILTCIHTAIHTLYRVHVHEHFFFFTGNGISIFKNHYRVSFLTLWHE